MQQDNKKAKCAVSKCLLGEPCRYDGKIKKAIDPPWDGSEIISVCPELAAGLCVPRTPCEICGGDGKDVLFGKARVVDINGLDKTKEYIRGAEICAEICRKAGISRAYLKSKSPECGYGRIYDGTHSGNLITGYGIFAYMLTQMGIEVIETESD